MVAAVAQSSQPIGAVPAHAGEEHADNLALPEAVNAFEKDIYGRTVGFLERDAGVGEACRAGESEMMFCPGKQNLGRLRTVALSGQTNRQWRLVIEPVRQALSELGVHVLNNYDGSREFRRQCREHFGHSRRSSGGSADGDELIVSMSKLGTNRCGWQCCFSSQPR